MGIWPGGSKSRPMAAAAAVGLIGTLAWTALANPTAAGIGAFGGGLGQPVPSRSGVMPQDEQPAEVRLCFGFVQMLDGAARARMALVSGDGPLLRLAARSIDQGHDDATEAAAELGGPSLDDVSEPVRKVAALARVPNVVRQPQIFVPVLDDLVDAVTDVANQADCARVLTEGT